VLDMKDRLLAQTFVQLADTLAGNFDAVDFLHVVVSGSTGLLETDAAGVVLADAKGRLRVVAASDERARLLELLSLQLSEGVGFDAHVSGELVSADLAASTERWPAFAPSALEIGYRSVCAFPLRMRDTPLGALTVFRRSSVPLTPDQVVLGKALADVAAIGLLQQRAVRQAELLAEQLQQALDSRVLLEQAKGVLAERLDLDVSEAFHVLRRAARNSNTRLSDYARMVIESPRASPGPEGHRR